MGIIYILPFSPIQGLKRKNAFYISRWLPIRALKKMEPTHKMFFRVLYSFQIWLKNVAETPNCFNTATQPPTLYMDSSFLVLS